MKYRSVVTAALLSFAAGASAVPIHYEFEASNFYDSWEGATSPFSSIRGSFVVDNDTVTQLDLSIGTYEFNTENSEWRLFREPYITIGGVEGGMGGVSSWTYDFRLTYTPDYNSFTYVYGGRSLFNAADLYIKTWKETTAAVPEPSTLALLAAGFLGLAYSRRKTEA